MGVRARREIKADRGMSKSTMKHLILIRRRLVEFKPFLATCLVVALCRLLGWCTALLGLIIANTMMVFLAGVSLVAARFGHWPAVLAAVLSVLVFDYFFVP